MAQQERTQLGTMRLLIRSLASLKDFGAFVEILPGKEGLCHISKLSRGRVEKVTDVLKEGQQIPVKLLEVDQRGRLQLSYIDAIEESK